MSEGGQFSWKRQTIDYSRGPVGDYAGLRVPLPNPPDGYEWEKVGKDWTLKNTTTTATNNNKAVNKSTEKISNEWTFQQMKKNGKSQFEETSRTPDSDAKKGKKVILSKLAEPANKVASTAVENVDYLRHTVLPTDTLQGLCLRYKVSATRLRQMNKFSGTNLLLAPSHLVVPLEGKSIDDLIIQDKSAPEYKLQALLAEFPKLRYTERMAYLELNDWDLDAAITNIEDDIAWEKEQQQKQKNNENLTTITRARKKEIHIDVAIPVKSTGNTPVLSKEEEADALMQPLLKEFEMPRIYY